MVREFLLDKLWHVSFPANILLLTLCPFMPIYVESNLIECNENYSQEPCSFMFLQQWNTKHSKMIRLTGLQTWHFLTICLLIKYLPGTGGSQELPTLILQERKSFLNAFFCIFLHFCSFLYSCERGYTGARCERLDLFYLRGDQSQIVVISLVAVMVMLIILVVCICTGTQ